MCQFFFGGIASVGAGFGDWRRAAGVDKVLEGVGIWAWLAPSARWVIR